MLTRILEEREQSQQQQNNDDPEGEVAQIGVHRSSFVVARIAAFSLVSTLGVPLPIPLAVFLGLLSESPEGTSHATAYNLGVASVDAKGTTQDYLTHIS